ncbi:MAG TPA: glycoside hydrolase family 31 protein [Candidatus Angelobacter sp.]|nr:glycoside hydrolase family 31 protein [Candidatus Angelobacter sp.]
MISRKEFVIRRSASWRWPGLLLGLLAAWLVSPFTARAQWNPLNPVVSVQRQPDGVQLTLQNGVMRLQVYADSIIRVRISPATPTPAHPDLVVIKNNWPVVNWELQSSDDEIVLRTSQVKAVVARKDSSITFQDSAGKTLFQQTEAGLTPAVVNGEQTYHAELYSKLWGSYESFYGLGQHQAGVWNYRGEVVDISQDNTNISIPFVLSSNGYGIFWNNESRSRFNNRFLNALYLSSEVADALDYYFLYGPEFDKIIAGYRELTGAPPLFGKWAYGFWQCKNKYNTQEELLAVAHKYRELHIPADNIVQDWFWWYTMGEPVFDKSRYPDPPGMVEDLHKNNFHLMISFWPFIRPGTKTYEDMDQKGFFIDRTKVGAFHPARMALYDAFNPEARKYYWGLMDQALFKIGVDAWWLDTTEPETEDRETNVLVTNKTYLGNGARYANAFPLMTTSAVYQGQRSESDKKRVFILSRSAFAGAQRNAAAVWSGDVNSDWVFFKKQIPAGLNYSISGLPYWTTDIGGFVSGNPDDPAYRELFVRWFQFGTFNPILRVHGTRSTNQNELWSYGPEAQKILVNYDTLRYRLLPYTYSLAWMTTRQGYTPMRGLVMDFRSDPRSATIGDQFLFGPALMVNPVTDPGVNSRRVYLPKGKWYDFWTGALVEGARTIDASASLETLPLFVRAGSIVPLGPEKEWSTEKAEDPIELRVYHGANGDFTLYEDENDGYNYEKGIYATIPFHWDEAKQVLTIGDRAGQFPGMIAERSFHIVFVKEGHGAGISAEGKPDKIIRYAGKAITVTP